MPFFDKEININNDDWYEIIFLTHEIVYQAMLCIDLNSNDVTFGFDSNTIKIAAVISYKHLRVLFNAGLCSKKTNLLLTFPI